MSQRTSDEKAVEVSQPMAAETSTMDSRPKTRAQKIYSTLSYTPPRCRYDPDKPFEFSMGLNILFGTNINSPNGVTLLTSSSLRRLLHRRKPLLLAPNPQQTRHLLLRNRRTSLLHPHARPSRLRRRSPLPLPARRPPEAAHLRPLARLVHSHHVDRAVRHEEFRRFRRHNLHYIRHDSDAAAHAAIGRGHGDTEQEGVESEYCCQRDVAGDADCKGTVGRGDRVYWVAVYLLDRVRAAIFHTGVAVFLYAGLSQHEPGD